MRFNFPSLGLGFEGLEDALHRRMNVDIIQNGSLSGKDPRQDGTLAHNVWQFTDSPQVPSVRWYRPHCMQLPLMSWHRNHQRQGLKQFLFSLVRSVALFWRTQLVIPLLVNKWHKRLDIIFRSSSLFSSSLFLYFAFGWMFNFWCYVIWRNQLILPATVALLALHLRLRAFTPEKFGCRIYRHWV